MGYIWYRFGKSLIKDFMGQVTTFTPEGPSYEDTFKLPSAGKELTEDVVASVSKINKDVPPVIGPVPNIVGCLQAFEAVKNITGKGNIITAPNVLIFDLMKKEPFTMFEF